MAHTTQNATLETLKSMLCIDCMPSLSEDAIGHLGTMYGWVALQKYTIVWQMLVNKWHKIFRQHTTSVILGGLAPSTVPVLNRPSKSFRVVTYPIDSEKFVFVLAEKMNHINVPAYVMYDQINEPENVQMLTTRKCSELLTAMVNKLVTNSFSL